jgi:ATP-dependent protease HslVU (ClpYQ) ATPase subunit
MSWNDFSQRLRNGGLSDTELKVKVKQQTKAFNDAMTAWRKDIERQQTELQQRIEQRKREEEKLRQRQMQDSNSWLDPAILDAIKDLR